MSTNFIRSLLWLVCLITPLSAFTQQGDCGFIQNPDRQAYCRAISGGGSSHCRFIRDGDMQTQKSQP